MQVQKGFTVVETVCFDSFRRSRGLTMVFPTIVLEELMSGGDGRRAYNASGGLHCSRVKSIRFFECKECLKSYLGNSWLMYRFSLSPMEWLI